MSNPETPAATSPPKSIYGYEIIDLLGEGAGSIIYAASDPISRQIYALKHVVVRKEKDQRFIEQLTNEFEISAKVSHSLLRRCVDLKVTKPLLRKPTEAALIMEMFEGVSCEMRPPSEVLKIISVMKQTAQGIGAMHAQGFIHCDLKPNNILLASGGKIKIIDLGQACPIGTVKARIQGTPDFIAPEQVRCEPLTVQTDIYNLGATFYWILSGQKLPTLFTLKKAKNSFLVADAIPQPHELNPKVPANLSGLVMDCCRISASKRPEHIEEVLRRLEVVEFAVQQHEADGKAAQA